MVMSSQKAADAPFCCLHPGSSLQKSSWVFAPKEKLRKQRKPNPTCEVARALGRETRLLIGGRGRSGCLKRGTQLPARTHMKDIHLRAIGLEMEIHMGDFKEEERVRDSKDVHQSPATKLSTGALRSNAKWENGPLNCH